MEYVYYTVALILLVLGIVGCVLPVLPGPVIGYCALFCLIPTSVCPSVSIFIWLGMLAAVVTVADMIIPSIGAKKFDCSRYGTWGCFAGTVVGMFVLPIGVIAGPFLGAFLGELIAGKKTRDAVRGGVGALLGFLAGTFLKLVVCVLITGVVVFQML